MPILFSSLVPVEINPAFGLGVFVVKPATDSEYRARFLGETYTAEEMTVSRRFNVTLAEAREMIADSGEALRSAELDRLAAWDAVNEAEAHDPAEAPLFIGGRAYAVRAIPAGEFGDTAYRLTKADGTVYDLIRNEYGMVECTCADYTFRHAGNYGMCKHGKACVAALLMAPPRLVRKPALATAGAPGEFDAHN